MRADSGTVKWNCMSCVNDTKDLSFALSGIDFDSVLSSVKGDVWQWCAVYLYPIWQAALYQKPPSQAQHRLPASCIFHLLSCVTYTHILWINLITQVLQVGLLNTARVQQLEYEVAAEYELKEVLWQLTLFPQAVQGKVMSSHFTLCFCASYKLVMNVCSLPWREQRKWLSSLLPSK